MKLLAGIGKIDRERIATIIRGTKGTISVDEAAGILNIASTEMDVPCASRPLYPNTIRIQNSGCAA